MTLRIIGACIVIHRYELTVRVVDIYMSRTILTNVPGMNTRTYSSANLEIRMHTT